jgi:hypothetical protein
MVDRGLQKQKIREGCLNSAIEKGPKPEAEPGEQVILVVYFTQEIYILFHKNNSSSTRRAAETTILFRSAHTALGLATDTFPRARRGRGRKWSKYGIRSKPIGIKNP